VRHLAAGLVLVATLVGCGSSSGGGQLSDEQHNTPGPIGPKAGASGGCQSAPPVVESPPGTTDLSKKPEVEVPDAPPPCNLVIGDIVRGKGPEAKAGQHLTMKYVGVLYSNGKQFDASWDNGQDFDFDLGAGSVIAGWDQGLVGMHVGGRRELVIPPELGYGDQGAGADIPPGATLIFVVDLVKIG
jgi:peptidylprolyl isomerase